MGPKCSPGNLVANVQAIENMTNAKITNQVNDHDRDAENRAESNVFVAVFRSIVFAPIMRSRLYLSNESASVIDGFRLWKLIKLGKLTKPLAENSAID
ncbi:MAG: hypothetical protein J2P21_23500, partial [Chloracidobacterium sp.]|nr:hypothetical protein [Chloracidobacterium sp.]